VRLGAGISTSAWETVSTGTSWRGRRWRSPRSRRAHEVIADVVGRVDPLGVGRVADRAVEIEYGVELVASADPGVDLLAGRLTECP
jgi:hypothetical protein